MGGLFHRRFETGDKQKQYRRYCYSYESKIPVHIEHESKHAHNRQRIDENAQQGRRSKTLNGGNIRSNGAQYISNLMRIVVGKGKALKMMIYFLPKIVGYILRNTLCVIVVDITRNPTNQCNQNETDGCRSGYGHFICFKR